MSSESVRDRIPLDVAGYDAVIFDMDGVLTATARVHAQAWKEMFDAYLAVRMGPSVDPFDIESDYTRHVDGKSREDGVASFLASRGIALPRGTPDDPPDRETVCGLGRRKNALFLARIRREGVAPFDDAVELVGHLRAAGLRVAVISASLNAAEVLEAAGIADAFDARVDGVVAAERALRGKPEPDMFLEAARQLAVSPDRCAVIEDAIAGVVAGRRGRFARVIGVARRGNAGALVEAGAHAVVPDLSVVDLVRGGESAARPPASAVALRAEEVGPETRERSDPRVSRSDAGAWSLVYDSYVPEQERLREALCTLGNGYFATRGAAADVQADATHYPGTYLAGGYDRAETRIQGRDVENEDLVNLPSWLSLTFRIDGGEWLHIDQVELLEYRQELRMDTGILERELALRDAAGRTTRWRERRVVSMAQAHLAALSVDIVPEDWQGKIELRSALDGRVTNAGVPRYRALEGRHLEVLAAERVGTDRILLRARTLQSRLEVVEVARTRIFRGREIEAEVAGEGDAGAEGADELATERGTDVQPGWVAERIALEVDVAAPIRVEKVIALHTSRDPAISEAGQAACDAAHDAPSFDTIAARHAQEWRALWESFDLRLELTDPAEESETLRKLRLHTFHLLQTVSARSADLDVSVPARGWHGEAYRGHIFWDELFVFPLLNLRMPRLSRVLLQYRYRRLREAQRAARAAGLRGAMFPWQSGSDGREETQRLHLNPLSGRWLPDRTHLQRHIGSAIAYNVWQYHQATNDHDFLYHQGAELILEIARFWGSIATYDGELDRYEIRGVMGPDEYHTAYPGASEDDGGGVHNNAYTNVMAAWVLERASDVLALLPERRRRQLCAHLGLRDAELEAWEEISRKLRVCFHDGIISQFEGYEELAEFDWPRYRQKYGDIHRLDRILEAEGDSPNRYKASKQADVLMLFYLFSADELELMFERLGYRWDHDLIPRNIAYYLQRTSHGSTLSRVTHAWVLARSDRPASWALFRDTLDSDVADGQGGTTAEGIHVGAMAGSLDLLQRCYTGVELHGGTLHFDPRLPEELRCVGLELRYRGHLLGVEATHESLRITSRPLVAEPITVACRGHCRPLAPGEQCRFRLVTPSARAGEPVGSTYATTMLRRRPAST